ncbi:MAG: SMC-Scp complex subunit ScpB [Deltaproteobacteria bacterium]|nr:MAG: SMC-Scp complex subunit ScpB [Deltaproteobacteria bacterium]
MGSAEAAAHPPGSAPDEARGAAGVDAATAEVSDGANEAEGAGTAASALDPTRDPERERFERLKQRAASFSDARVRTILESLLLVAEKPLTPKEVEAATGIAPARVQKVMEAIAADHREGVSGIVLCEVAGGYQLRTCPTSTEFVRRFLRVKPARLTRAALETLAIVAYRQPVTRPEIEEIRGVDSGAVLKALLDKGLVQVLGKKEEPGRPLLYGTTRAFLEFFGLKDLASLPTLREYHELTEEHREIVEAHDAAAADAVGGAGGFVADLMGSGRLEAAREEDEAALRDLDEAMAQVEEKARETEAALDPGRAAEGSGGAHVEAGASEAPRAGKPQGAGPGDPASERGPRGEGEENGAAGDGKARDVEGP